MLKKIKVKKEAAWLLLIFLTAIFSRFLFFKESTYFGFDEARDAYTAQAIYHDRDFRLIGPPANAPGLNHGPMYWYLLGPLYFLGNHNPYFVSAVFRILNALGVLVVFWIAKTFFNPLVGFLAAAFFAFSFEQNQYAMYVCHPPLAIFSWLAIFAGAAMLFKNKGKKSWTLPLIFGGAASAFQFELLMVHAFAVVAALLFFLRNKLKTIALSSWAAGIIAALFFLSTYIVSEIKFGFRSFISAFNLLKSGYGVMPAEDTRFSLFLRNFLLLIEDNILPIKGILPALLATALLIFLLLHLKKEPSVKFILLWILGGIFFLPLGGYNAYYVNAGIGVGIIIGFSFLVSKVWAKNKILGVLIITLVLGANFIHTYNQKKDSLIVDLKPQPFMKLADEQRVIEKMYAYAEGGGFTIRATNIPFSIPTVWAYLFENYAQKKFGYLPYWETGPVLGFPGELPKPKQGSTCVRFLLQEPSRGIPGVLIEYNQKEEALFSTVVKEEKIGDFILQTRKSVDKDCHNRRPEE